jgi:hypothetical protein
MRASDQIGGNVGADGRQKRARRPRLENASGGPDVAVKN